MKNKKPTHRRPTWDEYFLELARLVSSRSTCVRRRVGAVLVKDKKILATGYNGAPSGLRHCIDIGCLREKLKIPSGQRHELCRGLHAEQNVLLQAALYATSTRDSALYVTNQPCLICAKMLINAGVKEIITAGDYPDQLSGKFLKEAKIKVRKMRGNVLIAVIKKTRSWIRALPRRNPPSGAGANA